MTTSIQNSENPLRRIKRIHFVGIGGVGMCGIAEVLLNLGYQVSGSDLAESATTQRLAKFGAKIFIGHNGMNIEGAEVVVRSSAVKSDNPEILEAQAKRIPIIARAEMLAELMRFQFGIAIAGTHGKTTTTSLVTSVLAQGGLDPTYVIGGKLNSSGTTAQLGKSSYFVAEADESDASFLYLKPMISVVTNIDADHMETYSDDLSRLRQTFLEFLHHLPFYGLAVLCNDDPAIQLILPQLARPYLTYGMTDEADVYAKNCVQRGTQNFFTVHRHGGHSELDVTLNLPGAHNILNAMAAITVATELGVPDHAICAALENFAGIGRRFQSYGEIVLGGNQVTLIDDYGHHPREMAATIQAMRKAWPEKRLVLAFQPHRYSRTQALFDDFVIALSSADVALVLDIYAAGETPIEGITSRALCQSLRQRGQVEPIYVSKEDDLSDLLANVVQKGDIVMTLGAGNIGAMAAKMGQDFKATA